MGEYTNEANIEDEIQTDIGSGTNPNRHAVDRWITQVDAEIDERTLYQYTATDEVDAVGTRPTDIQSWGRMWWPNPFRPPGGGFLPSFYRDVLYPSHLPIVSVTNLYVNDSGPSAEPSWTQLYEFATAGETSSFTLDYVGVAGGRLGTAVRFYRNWLKTGSSRIKMTYLYGYNFSTDILEEYATKKVAMQVLRAKAAAEDMSIDLSTGVWGALYSQLDARVEDLDVLFKGRERLVKRTHVPIAIL